MLFDGEHAVFIAGGYAKPVLPVVRGAGLIIFPAIGVGGLGGIFKMHHAILIGRALQSEVKPLCKIGGVVGAQGQADIDGVAQVGYGEGAGIETGADFLVISLKDKTYNVLLYCYLGEVCLLFFCTGCLVCA